MALDSQLVFRLTDALKDVSHHLEETRKENRGQRALLRDIRDALRQQNEQLAAGVGADDEDDDDVDEPSSDDSEESKLNREIELPDWLPVPAQKWLLEKKDNPGAILEMLSKFQSLAGGGKANGKASSARKE